MLLAELSVPRAVTMAWPSACGNGGPAAPVNLPAKMAFDIIPAFLALDIIINILIPNANWRDICRVYMHRNDKQETRETRG